MENRTPDKIYTDVSPASCVSRMYIHALSSVVIGLGSVVCRLWLCLPPSHLWLPVAWGVTSFHNSHLQKDAGLYASVPLFVFIFFIYNNSDVVTQNLTSS